MNLARRAFDVWVGFLILSVGLAAVEVRAQQELRWKLNPGEVLHLTHAFNQESTLVNGPPSRFSRVEDVTWHVDRVESDGSMRITQTVDRIRMTVPPHKDERGVERSELQFDTAQSHAPGSAEARRVEQVKPLIGAKFSFTLQPTGEIRALTPSDEIRGLAAAATPGVARMLGDNALKSHIPMTLLPDQGFARIGQSWTEKALFTDPIRGTRNLNVRYRYAGRVDRDGKSLEEIELEVEPELNAAPNSPYPTQIHERMSRGRIVFDTASGRLIEWRKKETSKQTLTIANRQYDQDQERTETTTLTRPEGARAP